jgi:hypothetical protein
MLMAAFTQASNGEGDVVLIYYQDQPTQYARIEFIKTDIKKGWYQVTLLLLTVPTQTVTWILRDIYINGEPFTMDGVSMRLERVDRVALEKEPARHDPVNRDKTLNSQTKGPKVLPFKKK